MDIVQKNSVVVERKRRMNKKVVIINGSAGVGKDEFVNQIRTIFSLDPYFPEIYNYSSVDWIKEVATMMGWNGKKDEKSRKFLSDLKDLSTQYNDMPLKKMSEVVEMFKEHHSLKILFLHIREPEEIEKAKKEFDAKTLLIKSNRVRHVVSNHADGEVFEYSYDYTINNDGTLDDLWNEACKFVNWLGVGI